MCFDRNHSYTSCEQTITGIGKYQYTRSFMLNSNIHFGINTTIKLITSNKSDVSIMKINIICNITATTNLIDLSVTVSLPNISNVTRN